MTQADSTRNVQAIPLDLVVPSAFQVRLAHDEDALAELTASLRVHGLLQPIVVREIHGEFETIAGHRRVMAARELGWMVITAVVRDADDATAAALTIEENLQRKDLSGVEIATALKRYIDTFNVTQAEVGERFSMAQETVSNYLRVLGLPDDIQALVKSGELGVSHAKALIPLAEVAPKVAIRVASEAAQHGQSVQAVTDTVRWRVQDEQSKAVKRQERKEGQPAIEANKEKVRATLLDGLEELSQPVQVGNIKSHYYRTDKAGNLIPIAFAPVVIGGQTYKPLQPSQDLPTEHYYSEPPIVPLQAIRDRVDTPRDCEVCPQRIVVRALPANQYHPYETILDKPPVDLWCCANKECRAAKLKVRVDRHRQQWEADTKSSLADLKVFLKAHQTSDDAQALALMLALDHRHDLKEALALVKQVLAAPQDTFLAVLTSRAAEVAKAESQWYEGRLIRKETPVLRALLDTIAKPTEGTAKQKGKVGEAEP